jgi:class 3 adenylate cyclase
MEQELRQLMPRSRKTSTASGTTAAPTPGTAAVAIAKQVGDLAWAGQHAMAVFGAPLPLPDPCAGAVRTALEMIETIELFNLERATADKPQIRIGIGIASGEMVAGYAGTNERATYTCIGDTVNLASRLEAHTKVAERTILIDGATRTALGDRIGVEQLGPVPIRGKAAPVDVYSVNLGQKI